MDNNKDTIRKLGKYRTIPDCGLILRFNGQKVYVGLEIETKLFSTAKFQRFEVTWNKELL